MLDKIIIISWSNYDQRIGDQFDVLYLINNGYVVEYWDVSNITIPGYSVKNCIPPEGLVNVKFENKKEFIGRVNKERHSYFIVYMNCCPKSFFCYRILSKFNCFQIYCVNGVLPAVSKITRYSQYIRILSLDNILQIFQIIIFSLLLNTDVPCRTLFRVLILIPWVISPAVSSMSWSWLLSDQYGFFNNFLKSIGVIDKSILFLADKTLAKIMVIIIGAWRNFPFITVSLLAGLQGISKDYYEAADIDGANKFQRFRYVTFPHLKNVSIITITLVSIWTFNNFDNIYMLTKGGPAQSTEVLSILAYNNAFFRGNISYASAMATVMLVIMLIASGVYFKVSKYGKE